MKLIVIASPCELELARKEIELNGWRQAAIAVVGVGGLNVIQALAQIDKDAEILNVGYAGSTDIPIGTRVEVQGVALYHPNVEYKETSYHINETGVMCWTSNDFVLKSDKKGCVFDMELAYICAMGFNNVKAVKYVSDNCSYEEYEKSINNED